MAWTFISHLSSPTSDQFNWTGLSLSGYQRIMLVLDGLVVGTDGVAINMQLGTGGSLHTTGYRYGTALRSSSGSTDSTSANTPGSTANIRLLGGSTLGTWGVGNASGESGSCVVYVANCNVAVYKQVECQGALVAPSGAVVRCNGAGLLEQTGNITDIRVLTSSGTLTSGKATLYGLPTS